MTGLLGWVWLAPGAADSWFGVTGESWTPLGTLVTIPGLVGDVRRTDAGQVGERGLEVVVLATGPC